MRVFKIETVEDKVVKDIICNKCENIIGKSQRLYGNYFATCYRGGFDSKLGDGEEYYLDICEKCLIEWFLTFKVDPQTKDVEEQNA